MVGDAKQGAKRVPRQFSVAMGRLSASHKLVEMERAGAVEFS